MRVHPTRPIKLAARVASVLLVGVLATACSSGGGPSANPAVQSNGQGTTSTSTTAPSSTTSTTLAGCGAKRDPLDPTDAPPPSGSPANC
jgi:hypothetical protein